MFDFAKKKKMSIVADLSRRLHLLTTDAKPDPPRTPIEDETDHLPSPSDRRSKSCPSTPDANENNDGPLKNSLGQSHTTAKDDDESDSASSENEASLKGNKKNRDQHIPRFKTKNPYKTAHTANVVNYNIVNSNGVKIGATKTYVWNVNQCTKNTGEFKCELNNTARGKTRKMPRSVEDLSVCEREITVDDIFVIKTHIGHGWRDVARRLGYSEGQLDQFEENHRNKGIDEVMYQAFLDWKQANTKDAQIGTLTKALWSCREYECAERLANAQDTRT